ncbi:Sec23/Sec24 trunk domain-containing protein [Dichotomocladium elegans]|nr:Sec23/Sec24 trunk domain-containing protein [Dichotomocladium elegans]
MASQQHPPYPIQQQQQQQQQHQQHTQPPHGTWQPMQQPMQQPGPPAMMPQGYRPVRPVGSPSGPPPPHPGMPYRAAGTPPPLPRQGSSSPKMQPGYRPMSPQQPSAVSPRLNAAPSPTMGARPPPPQAMGSPVPSMMRPIHRVMSPPVGQPSPPAAGRVSPVIPTGSPAPPSPGVDSHAVRQHHHRKRMYPEQITNAYLDQTPGAGAGSQGRSSMDGYGAGAYSQPQQAMPPQQPPMMGSPMPTMARQPYPGAQGAQGPAFSPGQVSSVTGQFGNMSLGPQSTGHSEPLLNAPPLVANIYNPPPPIILPPNASVTNSPHANCDQSYKCCTINAVPANETVLKKSKLPFALVLSPYRTADNEQDEVPVVSDHVIARCRRCRTYINPFVSFVEGGQRWKCNMCFLLNDVPAAFDYDAQTQQPADRWQRAELNYACVEYVAPTEYTVRPPQAPSYIFIIDVSYSAVQSGMVATAARTILDSLERIPNKDERTRVGFITVDSSVHFYNLSSALSEPQMLVVSDLEDIFLPSPTHLLVSLSESKGLITNFLEKLPDMFKDTANVNNALGSALQAAFQIVSPAGGKIICLQSTLPNMGTGALKAREDPKVLGTAKETSLLNAASPFFKSFAVDCSRSQVSCDMLIFGGQYADVATLGCLPRFTGGQTYFYPGFNASRTEDTLRFAHEFAELLAEEIGLEAVLRIRASRNLRMSAFHGNFFIRSTDLLALPSVPRNQSYCVEVSIEDEVRGPTACFQTALLHTTCYGERRIRVITLCLPVTSSVPDMVNSVNPQAVVAYLANKAVERGLTTKLEDARDAVVNKVVDILGVYKSQVLGVGKGSSSPQLFAPEHLRLLPALALALIKHDALRSTSIIPSDHRSNAMNLIRTMPLQLLIPYIYPNLYALHAMPPDAGEISEHGVVLPPRMNLTMERLETHGCYLLENGQTIFIWVGRGAVPQLCLDLFGVKSYNEIPSGKYTFPTLETAINKKTNLLISKIREMRRGNYYPVVYTVKEDSDPSLRMWFLTHMIEDRTENVTSYQQFLQILKDRVNAGSF